MLTRPAPPPPPPPPPRCTGLGSATCPERRRASGEITMQAITSRLLAEHRKGTIACEAESQLPSSPFSSPSSSADWLGCRPWTSPEGRTAGRRRWLRACGVYLAPGSGVGSLNTSPVPLDGAISQWAPGGGERRTVYVGGREFSGTDGPPFCHQQAEAKTAAMPSRPAPTGHSRIAAWCR